jgi:hypothetical protein
MKRTMKEAFWRLVVSCPVDRRLPSNLSFCLALFMPKQTVTMSAARATQLLRLTT